MSEMCSSRKYIHTHPRKVIGNSERERGFSKAEIFKGKYEALLEFPGGVGVSNQKFSVGEMDGYFL